MKLATYHDGSRDGQLVVVSRDLALGHYASGIATRLQQVLDDWNFLSPQLEELSLSLNQGKARHAFPFDPAQCMAPLPRAFRWSRSPGSGESGAFRSVDGAGDAFQGPRGPIDLPAAGLHAAAGLAAVVADVAAGATPENAVDGIRLLMLALELSERTPADDPEAHPFNVQRCVATLFAPLALTLDEFDTAWHDGRLRVGLAVDRNGKRGPAVDLGSPARHHFGELIAELARSRRLGAGGIVGDMMAIGADDTAAGAPMQAGDAMRLNAQDREGASLFGTIEPRPAALA